MKPKLFICRICGKGSRGPILRSREIVGICMSCDIKLKGELRDYFRNKFGVLILNPKTGKFEHARLRP